MVKDGHDGGQEVRVARGQHVVVNEGQLQPPALLKSGQVHLISACGGEESREDPLGVEKRQWLKMKKNT